MPEKLALFIPFLFIPMWFLALYLTALVFGWMALAEKYARPGDKHSTGRTKLLSFLGVGMAHYNTCVMISTDSEGLYLSLFFIFRPFHKPLFIPWKNITAEMGTYFFFRCVNLKFEGFDMVFRIYEGEAGKNGILEHVKVKGRY